MATSTTNLGLTKPAVNDAADIGVLNSNFDKIDTAVAGKANSWYGLGEIGVYCSDCNNAQRNGWFCIDTNTANLPDSGVSGTLFVETRPSSYGVDVYQTIKSGVTVIQRYYSSWAGTWQPWEYVNPPMQVGMEYRTTERYEDKPVHRKAIALGALPSAAVKRYGGVYGALSSSVPDWDTIVDLKLIIKSSDGSFGAAATYGGKKASIWAEKTQGQPNLVVDTDTWDATGFNGWAYMTYTKA